MKKKLLLWMVCLFAGVSLGLAQTLSVQGVVTSGEDGEPIIGASVLVVGTQVGSMTDMDGKFTISNVPAGAKTLRISYVGMQTQEVAITAGKLIKVVLRADSEVLDEVVVTALGISRSEKSLGYSATTVKSDEIISARTTNVADALSGKVAGLQVSSTSSDPGSVSNVVIRGFGSINGDNQPLYVVDGIPLSNSSVSGNGKSVTLGGISNVASQDIESMTVLKGAAATALYGSRAANGVVIVTTKSGKRSRDRNFSINYSGSVQARQLSFLPELQNSFGQGWNGGQTFIENGSWGPALDGSTQVYGPVWNHQQLIHEFSAKEDNVKDFFDLGWSHNHNLSLSGESDDRKMTYYLSYSYTGDDGIIPEDYDMYKRNTVAFRNSYEPVKWLKLSSSVNFARSQTDAVDSFQGTSVIDGLLELPRDVSIVDMKDLSNPFYTPEAYFTPYGITNPYWSLANNRFHTNSKQIYGKVQADIKPVKNVTLTYRMGLDYTDYDIKTGSPQIDLDDALIDNDYGYPPSSMNQEGGVTALYSRRYELNHDFLANYAQKFLDDRLDVNVNVGVNMNERYSTYLNGSGTNLSIGTGFWDLSNTASQTLSESQSKRRLVGLFGDLTVGWDDMVYLNVTARNDWSSTLPIQQNSFFYPGATLSWIFTRLIPENDILSFGKLRLAYGKTGNDASPYSTSLSYIQGASNGYYVAPNISFPLNGANAYQTSNTLGSENLKPEMTSEFEVGMNLQFFNGRLGIDAAYYNRRTKDQIFTLPADPASGYSYVITNFGEVENKGVELAVNLTPVQTRNWRWDIGFNFAKNKNKVISLPESLEGGRVSIYGFAAGSDDVELYAVEGQPMGQFYTYLPQYTEDGKMIVDGNGFPILGTTLEDTGKNMNNDWTGGITTGLTFKDFTLSAALDIRKGGYMFSRTKNLMQFTGNGVVTTYNNRRPFVIPNSVVANEDGSYSPNTTPIYQYDGSYQTYFNDYGYGSGGEAYLMDRSFVKLRNISLTWNLPKKWVRAMQLNALSLTAFCNNVFMWTASDNRYADPESTTISSADDLGSQFGELYNNPSCRVFGCNLNITF